MTTTSLPGHTAPGVRALGARRRLATVGQWIDDFEADQQSKGRIVYVFDVDVIKMYSNPGLVAHYCALLRDEHTARFDFRRPADERDPTFCVAETLLADILGNHVVWGRADPALNSPAHADELADVAGAVVVDALKQLPELQERLRCEFTDLVATYRAAQPDVDRQAWLENQIDKVLAQVARSQPQVWEALRLHAAFEQTRVFSVDGYKLAQGEAGRQASFLPSAHDPVTGDFLEEVIALSQQLEKVLVAGAEFSKFKLEKLRTDARALAHLCWLNQQLEGNSEKVRVRFVTGAPHLHRLRLDPSQWVGALPQPIQKTFEALSSDLKNLIRHPLGFVDDAGVRKFLNLDGTGGFRGGRLGVWLRDRLLEDDGGRAELARQAMPSGSRALTKEAAKLIAANDQLVDAAAKELTALLVASRARQVVSPERNWLAGIVHNVIASESAEWDNIIREHVDSLLPKFLASLATLQRSTPSPTSVSRNLPPLAFADFKECAKFCTLLYVDHAHKSTAADDAKARLQDVIAADPSLYTPLIAIAMWRAADRDWPRARVMSEAAADLAGRFVDARAALGTDSDSVLQGSEGIFGEEAFYLHAVCIRLTAGRGRSGQPALNDLNRASDQLDRASSALAEFNKARGAVTQGKDIRHAAESVSIKLTKQLFAKLDSKLDSARSEERRLFDEAWPVFQEAQANVQAESPLTYARDYVLQQVSVSLAQLVLMDRYGVSGFEVFPILATTWSESEDYKPKIRSLWSALDNQCRRLDERHRGVIEQPSPVVSSLVRGVWKVFGLEFAVPLTIVESKLLGDEIRSSLTTRHRVASIDELRFNFLQKIADRKVDRG